MKLSRERLMEVVSYNPETGDFIRLVSRSNAVKSGSPAGWVLKAGYRVMHVNGRVYRASRLAWLYMTGEWPKYEI